MSQSDSHPASKHFRFISANLSRWLDSTLLSAESILTATAILVGLTTGLGSVGFYYLIGFVRDFGFIWVPEHLGQWGLAYIILVPVAGGIIAGVLTYFFAPEAKGHGVPEVMEAIALRGGRIRPVVALIKALASAFTIGSGGSAGSEGPVVQIGSAVGSTVGQVFHLSDERVRNLVACGAAAGISATFNAPIAGVIFALEVILGEFNVRYFTTVVIASVSASVVGQAFFGDRPAFSIPIQYSINSVWEFAFYALLGVLAAVLGAAFTRALYWTEDVFDSKKRIPGWTKPAIGGLLMGLIALAYPLLTGVAWDGFQPQVFAARYDVMEQALAGSLALKVVLVLMAVKLIMTCLTLGSGGSGGIFAPTLFMGAMLGSGFGLALNILFPSLNVPAGAYALVGMAAVFSASAHAPITAVLILFELTGDYRIILPLMLTVVIATVLAQALLGGESIYTLKLTRRGIRIQRGRDVDIMQGISAADVMDTEPHTVTVDTSLVELSERFYDTHYHGFPVLNNEGRLWGIVTVTDLDRAVTEQKPRRTPTHEIGTPLERLVTAYPDEPMGAVLARMGRRGLGRLPVVSREQPDKLLGLIQRDAIVQAYRLALARRGELQHRASRMQHHSDDGTSFIDVTLDPGDRGVGMSVGDIAAQLPHECILISVRRDDRILFPHGNTVFQSGDRVTAFVHTESTPILLDSLRGDHASADDAT